MGSVVSQAQQPVENDPNPEAAWWCKLLARAVGVIGAGLALFLGIWVCVTTKLSCILAGILQMIIAIIVLSIESPCCFFYVDALKPIQRFAERRTFLQKAIAYGILAIFPIAMCFGLGTLFGSGLIFASAVLYGLMGLGKKADRGEMMANAQGPQQSDMEYGHAGSGEPYSGLVGDDKLAKEQQGGYR